MLEPDEGDVVGDIDEPEFGHHLFDGTGYDDFARKCVRLSIHEVRRRSAFFE